jgi:hypothetical protein
MRVSLRLVRRVNLGNALHWDLHMLWDESVIRAQVSLYFFGTTDMRVVHIYVYPESFPVEAIINIIQFHLPSYLEDAESKFL